jgi:hypothetical protein
LGGFLGRRGNKKGSLKRIGNKGGSLKRKGNKGGFLERGILRYTLKRGELPIHLSLRKRGEEVVIYW